MFHDKTACKSENMFFPSCLKLGRKLFILILASICGEKTFFIVHIVLLYKALWSHQILR